MDRVAFYACLYKDKFFEVSINDQFRACHLKLKEHEYHASYYVDQRLIGSPAPRDGLMKLLRDAKQGKIDFIITNKMNRLALNKGNLLGIAQRLKRADVEVYNCIGNGKTLGQHLEAEITAAEKESFHRMAMEWEKRMDEQIELEFGELSPQQANFTGAAHGVGTDDNPVNPRFQPQEQTSHPESRL